MSAYFFQAQRVFVSIVFYAVALCLATIANLSHSLPMHVLTVGLLQVKLALQILEKVNTNYS